MIDTDAVKEHTHTHIYIQTYSHVHMHKHKQEKINARGGHAMIDTDAVKERASQMKARANQAFNKR
jgi:hypothetical protein